MKRSGHWSARQNMSHARRRRSSRSATIQTLEPRQLLAVDPTISEFQAINATTLMDDDGDFEDWIEIRNANADSFNLDGWFLTDDSDDLQKWEFPAVSIEAGQQIVVFASGKDRTDPDEVLHTNFGLSGSGDYLAIVRPDGTVSQDFGAQYPPQFEDQSYGLAIERDIVRLIDPESEISAFVPTDDVLGDSWQQTDFNDEAWFLGQQGVGYEVLLPGQEVQDDFDGDQLDPAWTVDIPVGGSSTVDQGNGQLLLSVPTGQDIEYEDRGLAPVVARDLPLGSPADWEIVTKITQRSTDRGSAGIGVVDGETGQLAVQLEYGSRLFFRLFAGGERQASRTRSSQDSYFLRLQRDGLAGTWTASYKTEEADAWTVIGVATDGIEGTPIVNDPMPVMYARTPSSTMQADYDFFQIIVPDQRAVYGPETGLDVGNEMFNNNASVYMRVPFSIAGDPSRFDELGMTVRYDDGFRAFINGVEVADRNVPVEASWNSQASGTFGAVNGRIPSVQINLLDAIETLQSGDNVLAIHGMNVSSLDEDFFFNTQLITADVLAESAQFFVTPTPNEPNDLPAAPQPVITGEQGVFFGNQVVALDLATPDDFLEIRYTLDGSLPTRQSPLYSGPVTLTESARLEARTFDISPQQRFDPSNSASGTFFAVGEDLREVTSDIPLVILDTLGQGLPGSDSTSLVGVNVVFFDVSKASGRSGIDAGIIDYLGRGGVRDRGSSTRGQPKPNMSFETWGPDGTDQDDDFDVSLAGLPAESDWVLHAPYNFDRAMLRNQFFMGLSNRIDRYAPRTQAVEVYFNRRDGVVTEADYAGTYVLMEKIKRGKDRVDIAKITPEDNDPNSEEISGGYIFKIDRIDPGEPAFRAGNQDINWVEPKSPRGRGDLDQKATPEQEDWIQAYINDFSQTLRNPDINDANGYTKYIDVDAWVDHHLINVLTFNVDALRLSAYFFKDRGKRLEFGPLWDCDRCMESTDDRDNDPEMWFNSGGTSFFTYPWWRELFQDPGFWQRYIDRWQELRKDVFSNDGIDDLLDELAADVAESADRNFAKWRGVRPRTNSAFPSGELDGTWQGEVEHMRDWLHTRADFMDRNFVQPVRYLIDGEEIPVDVKGVQVSPGQEVQIIGPEVVFLDDVFVSGEPGVTTARYLVPTDDSLGADWTAIGFDDSAWPAGPTGLGFDNAGGDFEEIVKTRISPDEVQDGATTILTRIPFTIGNLDDLSDGGLLLRMKYDDGFVAYINGVEVLAHNLRSGELTWDSRANTRRSSLDRVIAEVFEDFDLSGFRDLLVQGKNVLSIRGINSSSTSSDMLVLPELGTTAFGTNPNARVYYTEDGSDPRGPDGMPNASAKELKVGESVTVTENMRLNARNFDDISARDSEASIVRTDWSGPVQYDFVASPAELVIAEMNYNPSDASDEEMQAGFGNDDFEFVEILNTGANPADLIGVELTDGVEFDFFNSAVTTLEPGARLLVLRNQAAFEMRYGAGLPIAGVYEGTLDNDGEDLDLVDGTGDVIFSVNYADADPWPVRADGVGATLELTSPDSVTLATQSKWYSWRGSTEVDGSPGAAGSGAVGIVINEVLPRTEAPVNESDSIEIHNTTGTPLDIGGWGLSDSTSDFFKYNFPAQTTIPSGGYLVLDEDDFNPDNPPAGNTGFGLNGREGESVWLVQTNGDFVDDVHFRAALNGESFGRTPNATGRLAPLTRTSLGTDNGPPRVGPIVVTEIQYNPVLSDAATGIDPNLDASDLEFIEIYNPTGTVADLTGWRIRGGVDFEFADGTMLADGETVVLIKFNPDDPENINQLNAFRAHYGIDDQVRLLGGYSGQLSNSDDRVTLLRTDASPDDDPDLVIRVQEDEVLYDDLAPWPTSADGTGHSLQRKTPDAFGNAGQSWVATIPSVGSPDSTVRGDFNGDGIVNETDINLLFVEMRSDDPDLSFDLTADSLVNADDRNELVENILFTSFGDANLDSVFNSSDLVEVFIAGEYQDDISLNSLWQTGDWDGNGEFDSGDMVLAFTRGIYVAAVPRLAAIEKLDLIGAALGDGGVDESDSVTDESVLGQIVADRPLDSSLQVEILDEAVDSLFNSDGSPLRDSDDATALTDRDDDSSLDAGHI